MSVVFNRGWIGESIMQDPLPNEWRGYERRVFVLIAIFCFLIALFCFRFCLSSFIACRVHGGSGGSGGGLADKSNANVTVSASTVSVTEGQPVTLEAYVNPLATGTVTFITDRLRSVQRRSPGWHVGIALLETSFNAIGRRASPAVQRKRFLFGRYIRAHNDGVYNENLTASSVSLQASTTTPQYLTNVTFTATVSPAAATGTVTFITGRPTWVAPPSGRASPF